MYDNELGQKHSFWRETTNGAGREVHNYCAHLCVHSEPVSIHTRLGQVVERHDGLWDWKCHKSTLYPDFNGGMESQGVASSLELGKLKVSSGWGHPQLYCIMLPSTYNTLWWNGEQFRDDMKQLKRFYTRTEAQSVIDVHKKQWEGTECEGDTPWERTIVTRAEVFLK